MMSLGGNKQLSEFFSHYDLNDESVQTRYKTKAAEYYRHKLRNLCEGVPFSEEKPIYDLGREVILEKMRSP